MKRWYVVQVYAGFEEAVKADISRRISKEEQGKFFGDILIPSAKVKKFFEVDESEDQQLFPGYILIEMELTPESIRLVTSCPRVMKFLGGKEPVPLSKKEIDRIVSQIKGEVAVSAPVTVEFTVGSEVEIGDGPFKGFVGMVEKVDKEGERLTVMVNIFGRLTPVELRFDQVKH